MYFKAIFFTIASLGILISAKVTAQEFRRFSNRTVFAYYLGIADNLPEKTGRMFSFRSTFNYKIKPNYGIGIGVGQENQKTGSGTFDIGYNLFPIFLDSRYFFDKKLSGAEVFINPGYAFKIDNQWQKGLMLAMGASYPFSKRKHSNWNLGLTYRYQEVVGYYAAPVKLHGIGLGVGITFN